MSYFTQCGNGILLVNNTKNKGYIFEDILTYEFIQAEVQRAGFTMVRTNCYSYYNYCYYHKTIINYVISFRLSFKLTQSFCMERYPQYCANNNCGNSGIW